MGAQHLLVLGLELLIFIAHFVFMYLDKANYAWKKTETDWTTKHFIDSLTFRLDGWQPAPMRGEKIGFWQNIVRLLRKFLTYHQGQAFSSGPDDYLIWRLYSFTG